MKRLNDKQRNLAERNHNLIYSFAHKKNISIEEYYGALAEGLCKAAVSYDESKGRFSTLAYTCMANEMNGVWRKRHRKSSVPSDMIIYYDDKTNGGFSYEIEDSRLLDDMICAIMSKEFIDSLDYNDNEIVKMLLDGDSHVEISRKMSCNRQNVERRIKNIRCKICDYIYCDNK